MCFGLVPTWYCDRFLAVGRYTTDINWTRMHSRLQAMPVRHVYICALILIHVEYMERHAIVMDA